VDAFIDFLCPFCRRFELSSGPALASLVADGLVSLAYHPMNLLDEASTTNYSTRAAAASGCAADGGRFVQYAHALFVNQPPEGGPELSDTELAGIGRAVGLGGPAFTRCLSDAPYLDWPPYVTALGVDATPTVLVDGAAVRPSGRTPGAPVRDESSRGCRSVAQSSARRSFAGGVHFPGHDKWQRRASVRAMGGPGLVAGP
jgi:protein-disulfide isomerase